MVRLSKYNKSHKEDVINKLVNELQNSCGNTGFPKKRLGAKKLLKLVSSVKLLLQKTLSVTYPVSENEEVSIHKNKNWYSTQGKHFDLSYNIHIGRAYEGLIHLGYLKEVKPGVSNGTRGLYLTKFAATEKLTGHFTLAELKEFPFLYPADP